MSNFFDLQLLCDQIRELERVPITASTTNICLILAELRSKLRGRLHQEEKLKAEPDIFDDENYDDRDVL